MFLWLTFLVKGQYKKFTKMKIVETLENLLKKPSNKQTNDSW